MEKTIKEKINNLINEYEYVDESNIPSINLYMDQVTTFIDDNFLQFTDGQDEKLLTKTMINNYTKAGLLPRPEKKKYNKDHIILLILIYHYKNFVSMNDSKILLDQIKDLCANDDTMDNLTDLYNDICNNNANCKKKLLKDINEKISYIEKNSTDDKPSNLKEAFSLFNMLAYDVFNKKRIMDELISYISSIDNTNAEETK